MLLRLSCSCGWSISRRVPKHVFSDLMELIVKQHPLDSHILTPKGDSARMVALMIHRFLAEKRIGIGFKEAPCKADGFVLSGR
jgi:hypothetical protein